MTTQFHALRLSSEIKEHVLYFAARYHVDLNSIQHWTDNMIIVGEQKTELTIHIRQHEAVNDTPAGVYVTCFNKSGNVVGHNNVVGATL